MHVRRQKRIYGSMSPKLALLKHCERSALHRKVANNAYLYPVPLESFNSAK